MPGPPRDIRGRRSNGLRLSDLIGLTAGYGMASWLTRSFWPRSSTFSLQELVAVGFEFLWLGLAMSGPLILLLDRSRSLSPAAFSKSAPARRSDESRKELVETHQTQPYTKAELAWLAIGNYWIVLALFVVPVRAGDAPWVLIAIFNLILAGLMSLIPARAFPNESPRLWSHRAAVVLLWTFPIAWLDLILIAKTYL